MTYDQWKTRDPNEPYCDEPECDHDDYELDILTGRASCNMCDHRWYASDGEVAEEIEHQRYSDVNIGRENRRQWWRDKTYPVRMFVFRVLERIWPRKALSVLHDDEIPF